MNGVSWVNMHYFRHLFAKYLSHLQKNEGFIWRHDFVKSNLYFLCLLFNECTSSYYVHYTIFALFILDYNPSIIIYYNLLWHTYTYYSKRLLSHTFQFTFWCICMILHKADMLNFDVEMSKSNKIYQQSSLYLQSKWLQNVHCCCQWFERCYDVNTSRLNNGYT